MYGQVAYSQDRAARFYNNILEFSIHSQTRIRLQYVDCNRCNSACCTEIQRGRKEHAPPKEWLGKQDCRKDRNKGQQQSHFSFFIQALKSSLLSSSLRLRKLCLTARSSSHRAVTDRTLLRGVYYRAQNCDIVALVRPVQDQDWCGCIAGSTIKI